LLEQAGTHIIKNNKTWLYNVMDTIVVTVLIHS
jgi:hypothetical protein